MKEFLEVARRPVDTALIGYDYDNHPYVKGYGIIQLLNEATDGAWSFTIDEHWVENCKTKKGNQNFAHMVGTLVMYVKKDDDDSDIIEIKKTGTAGILRKENAKNCTNDYKALATSCIRKAASYAGFGAELWLDDAANNYIYSMNTPVVWTEELLKEHESAWIEIQDIITNYKIEDDDLNSFVHDWKSDYNTIDDILPEDIDEFVVELKKVISENAEA